MFKQEAKCSKRRNGSLIRKHGFTSRRNPRWDVLIRSARAMPDSFQNRVHRYNTSFAIAILCGLWVSSLSTPMQLSSDNPPPPRRIIAYVCTNPKCKPSFTNLYAYDQHRTHARNANTLCANVTMRREIIATKRAGVTTSVVTEIAPKGVHHMMVAHEWVQPALWSAPTNKLGYQGKIVKN